MTDYKLYKYYHAIPKHLRHQFREKVCNECQWSNSRFYRAINGQYKIKKLEEEYLKTLFQTPC